MYAFQRATGALILACAVTATAALAQTTTVDRGEHLYATMQTAISSKTANVGDPFTMTVTEPYPNGTDLSGATITGHVAKIVRAGQGTKAEIDLAFDRVNYPDGTSSPISATLDTLQTKTQSKNGAEVAAKTIGGMILGNVIGKTILHTGGGGVVGAIGGFVYGQNAKADVDVSQGAQAQLTLAQPLRARRQASP